MVFMFHNIPALTRKIKKKKPLTSDRRELLDIQKDVYLLLQNINTTKLN